MQKFDTGVFDDATEAKKDKILPEEEEKDILAPDVQTNRVIESSESKRKSKAVWSKPKLLKTSSKIELQPQVA